MLNVERLTRVWTERGGEREQDLRFLWAPFPSVPHTGSSPVKHAFVLTWVSYGNMAFLTEWLVVNTGKCCCLKITTWWPCLIFFQIALIVDQTLPLGRHYFEGSSFLLCMSSLLNMRTNSAEKLDEKWTCCLPGFKPTLMNALQRASHWPWIGQHSFIMIYLK